MSIKFIGCPSMKITISMSSIPTSHTISAMAYYMQFKKSSNNDFCKLKNMLKDRCVGDFKINQKLPNLSSTTREDRNNYGEQYNHSAYVTVYFEKIQDLANFKIRWKPFLY